MIKKLRKCAKILFNFFGWGVGKEVNNVQVILHIDIKPISEIFAIV